MYLLEGIAKSYVKQSFDNEEVSVLAHSDFFVSGGTGFSGRWLITVLRALFKPENSPHITIISRSPEKAQRLFHNCSNLVVLDWKSLDGYVRNHPSERKIIAIHASVPASSGVTVFDKDVTKLKLLTESFALLLGNQTNKPIFVNLSSGGVYLRPNIGSIPESEGLLKTSLTSAYDKVKFADEETVHRLTQKGVINGVNPRMFSFTGPGIDIPGRFALGSFLYEALKDNPVKITGNEYSVRSYLSPIDLGIWILKSAIYPTIQTVHIGSPEGQNMIDIARQVSRLFGTGEVEITYGINTELESYVPQTQQSEKQLHIKEILDFSSSLSIWKSQLL